MIPEDVYVPIYATSAFIAGWIFLDKHSFLNAGKYLAGAILIVGFGVAAFSSMQFKAAFLLPWLAAVSLFCGCELLSDQTTDLSVFSRLKPPTIKDSSPQERRELFVKFMSLDGADAYEVRERANELISYAKDKGVVENDLVMKVVSEIDPDNPHLARNR